MPRPVRASALTVIAALVVAAAPAGAAGTAERQPKRHNVVVVMTDDQDFRSMGAMPSTRRLFATRGTTFANAIVSFPLCCPSRATFLTGQYAHNHGVRWNTPPNGGYGRLDQREVLPRWLQRAGYRTIHIGKFLNQYGERDPREIPRGWSDWHGGVDPSTYDYYGFTLNHNGTLRTYPREERFYSTDVYAGLAEDAIRDAARRRKPFFLSVAPNAPHTVAVDSRATKEGSPALPPPRHADRYAATPMPRRPNFDEADVSDKPPLLARAFTWPMPEAEVTALQDHFRGRMGALRGVDDLVVRITKALKRHGAWGDTDLIFTSDNGWMLGEHRLRDPLSEDGRVTGMKFFPYEGASRVPLMAIGPDFPRGRTVDGVVGNVDLAPTVAEIAGARAGLPQDGRSLVPVARRPSLLDGRGVLLEGFENPRGAAPYRSIRTERFRLDRQADGVEQLFDLERDPWELESRHPDPGYARVKAALRAGLDRLATCRGTACAIDLGTLPEPGR